ncbi:MAG: hypothetical protein IJ228_05605 [Succinivibrio sp.]|nr:hypothetical protein [Succinivibrio sp.]
MDNEAEDEIIRIELRNKKNYIMLGILGIPVTLVLVFAAFAVKFHTGSMLLFALVLLFAACYFVRCTMHLMALGMSGIVFDKGNNTMKYGFFTYDLSSIKEIATHKVIYEKDGVEYYFIKLKSNKLAFKPRKLKFFISSGGSSEMEAYEQVLALLSEMSGVTIKQQRDKKDFWRKA